MVFITLTSSPEGSTLYMDGVRVKELPGFPLLEGKPDGLSVLVLGNSAIGKSYWAGDLLALAMYNRALSEQEVRKNHSRWGPAGLPVLEKRPGADRALPLHRDARGQCLQPGGRRALLVETGRLPSPAIGRLGMADKRAVETLEFLSGRCRQYPGFYSLWFFLRPLAAAIHPPAVPGAAILLLAALLSLGIELTQVYLPSRNSQASDVVFNILGTLIGLALLRLTAERRSHSENT